MRLTDLNPRWSSAGGEGVSGPDGQPVPLRVGVGLTFDCPCGAKEWWNRVVVEFANPLDGGEPITDKGWQRTGDTFETLTLTPSIQRVYSECHCHWHGYITAGEVRTV